MLFALVLGCLLFGAGCRSAGQDVARGAFDEAETWWQEQGQEKARAVATEVTDAAREMLQQMWKNRVADLERKVEEGKATPLEIAVYVLLGGLGAGGTKTILERLLIGKRAT